MNISERIQRAEQTPGDPRDLAKGIAATLSKAEAKQLLEDYIAEQIRRQRRIRNLESERKATTYSPRPSDYQMRQQDKKRRQQEILEAELEEMAERERKATEHFRSPEGQAEFAKECLWRQERTAQAMSERICLELAGEFMKSEFVVDGSGERATWEKATVDQHKRRAEYMIKQAATVSEDAARHLYAVRAIEDAGVRTLGELA